MRRATYVVHISPNCVLPLWTGWGKQKKKHTQTRPTATTTTNANIEYCDCVHKTKRQPVWVWLSTDSYTSSSVPIYLWNRENAHLFVGQTAIRIKANKLFFWVNILQNKINPSNNWNWLELNWSGFKSNCLCVCVKVSTKYFHSRIIVIEAVRSDEIDACLGRKEGRPAIWIWNFCGKLMLCLWQAIRNLLRYS